MKTYFLTDPHGNYKGVLQAIERSPFNPEKDLLITGGDYVDGGKHIEVGELMKYLMSLPNWRGVLGNHDKWMIDYIAGFKNGKHTLYNDWFPQGGKQTLDSLGISYLDYKVSRRALEQGTFLDDTEFPEFVSEFFSKLELFIELEDKNYAFVHAGWYPASLTISQALSNGFPASELYWDRDMWYDAADANVPYDKVFIGHTSSGDSKKGYKPKHCLPSKIGKIINCDTEAGSGGRVTIMDCDTEKYWQSDNTEILYPNMGCR